MSNIRTIPMLIPVSRFPVLPNRKTPFDCSIDDRMPHVRSICQVLGTVCLSLSFLFLGIKGNAQPLNVRLKEALPAMKACADSIDSKCDGSGCGGSRITIAYHASNVYLCTGEQMQPEDE